VRRLLVCSVAALLGAAATLEAVNGDWPSFLFTLLLLVGLPSLARLW
jgi:hypothetical protein